MAAVPGRLVGQKGGANSSSSRVRSRAWTSLRQSQSGKGSLPSHEGYLGFCLATPSHIQASALVMSRRHHSDDAVARVERQLMRRPELPRSPRVLARPGVGIPAPEPSLWRRFVANSGLNAPRNKGGCAPVVPEHPAKAFIGSIDVLGGPRTPDRKIQP
jgi:hypothetical protein